MVCCGCPRRRIEEKIKRIRVKKLGKNDNFRLLFPFVYCRYVASRLIFGGRLGQIAYSWPIVPLQAYGRPSKAKALMANIKLQQRNGQHQNLYIVPPSASVIAGQICTVSTNGGALGPLQSTQQQQQQQYSTLASVLAVKFIPKLL